MSQPFSAETAKKSNNRANPMARLKKIRELVMGFLYLAVAITMIVVTYTGSLKIFEPKFTYGLAAVFIVYGIFRLYRTFTQKY